MDDIYEFQYEQKVPNGATLWVKTTATTVGLEEKRDMISYLSHLVSSDIVRDVSYKCTGKDI